jgi:hypothetical protein
VVIICGQMHEHAASHAIRPLCACALALNGRLPLELLGELGAHLGEVAQGPP